MFELPSRKDVSKCVITKETIEKGLKPTLVTSAGGRSRAGRTRRRISLVGRETTGFPPNALPSGIAARVTWVRLPPG